MRNSKLNKTKLSNINGLRLLSEIYKAESLKFASEQLGISVSVASHQLSSLRQYFQDPLFFRSKNGLSPSPKLLALLPKIQLIIQEIDQLKAKEKFDPEKVTRDFNIFSFDNGYITFILPVLKKILEKAPRLNLTISSFPRNESLVDELKKGHADLCIKPNAPDDKNLEIYPLRTLEFVLAVRKNHPLIDKWKKSKYRLEREWLLPYTQFVPALNNEGDPRPWIKLKELGMRTISSPYFDSTPFFIENSNAIEWLPDYSAQLFKKLGMIEVLPFSETKSMEFTPKLFWLKRLNNDPLHQWIRSIIITAAKKQ